MNMLDDLRAALALSEKATPGEWEHEKEEHDIGRGMTMFKSVVRQVGGENIIRLGYPSDDCVLIAAAVNFLRTHAADLEQVAKDAALGAYCRKQMTESGPIRVSSGEVYSAVLPVVPRDAGLQAAIDAAQEKGNG